MQQIKDAGLILLLALAVLLPQLAGYPLLEPDEARYVEIPREMLASGNYVIPRLNDIIYLEKPPLFYWLQTLSIREFGIHEMALRFWNAFFAAFTCVMVYLTGSTLYNRKTGWLAAGLLFSGLLFFAMAHFITLDMTFSALLSSCLMSLLLAVNKTQDGSRSWFYLAYTFAALAVLTKGLIGMLLPGAIFLLWLIATQQWAILKRACIPTGVCLFLAITLPWHILAQQQVPQFFDFYILGQQFLRYLTLAEDRYQPIWFFGVILFAGLMPWTYFALQAVARQANQVRLSFKHYPTETFLLIWSALIFVFFSLSKSKLVPYILPVLPPLMLLLSHDLLTHGRKTWEWVATLLTLVLAGAALAAFPWVSDHHLDAMLLASHRTVFYGLSGVCVLTVLLCLALNISKKITASFLALAAGTLLAFSAAIPLASQISDRSIKPLAEIIRAQEGQFDELVSFRRYFQDLPVYTEQIVTVVDRKGELDFGMSLEDKTDHMISYATFKQRWNAEGYRMLVVTSKDNYLKYFAADPKTQLLGSTTRYVLIGN
jgi:4-amino-4-deoxy-L-arabinose transferase-like glycosyltransferase